MEATAAERYASGGPGRDLYAQNLALAFQATVDRLGDDPAIRAGRRRRRVGSPGTSCASRSARIAGGLAALGVAQGRHGRAHAQQPARVHPDRPAAVVTSARCRSRSTRPPRRSRSQYVVARRRAPGRDRRAGVPRAAARRRARTLPDARARDRRRRRAAATDHARGARARSTRTSTSRPRGARSSPTTCSTLIYTSGTTGPPKGVAAHPRATCSTLTAGVDEHRSTSPTAARRSSPGCRRPTSPSAARTTTCR